MLALALWRADRCPRCGGDIDVCTSQDNDGKYVPALPLRCHATTAVSIQQKQYEDTPQAEALLWRVEKK